jgi:hypothetical protein
MKPFKLLIALALIIPFTSCTVQKRLYRNGYSVNWSSDNKAPKSKVLINEIENSVSELKVENTDLALTSNGIVLEEKSVVSLNDEKLIFKEYDNESIIDTLKCDLMLLTNGEEISVKIIEITPTDVKFKRCDNLEGPTKMISKNYILSITHSDDTKEVLKNEDGSIPISTETSSKLKSTNNASDDREMELAKASLAFGILGNVLLFIALIAGGYIIIYSVVGGISAIILGSSQLLKIRKQPKVYGGKRIAKTGLFLGVFLITLLFLAFFSYLFNGSGSV